MKKKIKYLLFALVGCLCLSGMLTENAVAATAATKSVKAKTSDMKVHFIDVGQADSILIQSEGENMLVDAGNRDDGSMLVKYLQKQGVKRIDYLIGTHPHEDHIGGMLDVIRNFEIGDVIIPQKEHTTATFENFIDAVAEKNLSLTKPVVGQKYDLGDAQFTIIAPNKVYGDELNNWSVGIKLVNGKNSFIMCGDAEKEAEKDICNNHIDLKADVLKLGHHGSSTATSKAILEAVDPSYAVISCGKDNSYGHPHQETMDALQNRDIKIFRTDLQGTIVAESDGTTIQFSEKPCDDYQAGGGSKGQTEKKKIGSDREVPTRETPTRKTPTREAPTREEPTRETPTRKTPTRETPTIEEPTESALPTPAGSYIGNVNNHKLHRSTCHSLPKDKNRVYFDTRDEAVSAGYSDACRNCNP
ncbi:MAG: MBL fold metallo-hydrolase [Clostridia bacterium]|nr:MBL fold metallo-hydrolase [Clostridia bacterium]